MAKLYDAIDFLWDDTAGDFVIGSNGDIGSTDFDPLQAIAQEIYTRMKSDKGDWLEAPFLGASLSEFTGEKNTRDVGNAIKKRVISTLQTYGDISAGDVSVDVVPIAKDAVTVTVQLRVMPTSLNKNSRVLKKTFIYSFIENNTYAR